MHTSHKLYSYESRSAYIYTSHELYTLHTRHRMYTCKYINEPRTKYIRVTICTHVYESQTVNIICKSKTVYIYIHASHELYVYKSRSAHTCTITNCIHSIQFTDCIYIYIYICTSLKLYSYESRSAYIYTSHELYTLHYIQVTDYIYIYI